MKVVFLFLIFFCFFDYSYCAYIVNSKGNVYYKDKDNQNWIKLGENKRVDIKPQTEITTERASSVEVYFDDGSKLKIGPSSYYVFNQENDKEIKSSLVVGKIRNWVRKMSKEYSVKTPQAVCGVRGTDFVVESQSDGTRVEVYDGSVEVKDNRDKSFTVRKGEFALVDNQGIQRPGPNHNPPSNLESSLSQKMMAKKEIYSEISKEEVMKRAQAEMQSAEYQNRKTSIDAFGYRVRMEEYVTRPTEKQFKYVVLNTRENRFDFGKILFTFNDTLPRDLSSVTKNMMEYYGNVKPSIYLTGINSVISNTVDKVTEEGTGGDMKADNPDNPSVWTHTFSDYSFYAAGKNESNENDGKGRLLWSYSNGNYTYLGGVKPESIKLNPDGDDVLHNYSKNTYTDGTWISADDYIVFDSGKVATLSDFSLKSGEDKNSFIDKLNFERVYKSSLFSDKIDLIFSAKLLKDIGIINIDNK